MHARLYVEKRRGGLTLDHGCDMSNTQTSCNRHNNLVLVPNCNAGRLDEDMEWERNGEDIHAKNNQERGGRKAQIAKGLCQCGWCSLLGDQNKPGDTHGSGCDPDLDIMTN